MSTAKLVRELSWSEKELPQKERTKHVHSIHQYVGKFVPQLVDYFLERDLSKSKLICDPFMGSGTTLVESNVYGIPSIGLDISKFNVMLCNVKTKNYNVQNLKKEINAILEETLSYTLKTTLDNFISNKKKRKLGIITNSEYLNTWYHPEALHALLVFRDLIPQHKYQDVMKVILSRSARSSRMIAHYETDYPKKPQKNDYYCIKHDRTCHPTKNSISFLKRYCHDVVKRIDQFQQIRNDVYTKALHGDSSKFDFSKLNINDVFTSPPYIGLIDYHDQHRYAYELLGLQDNSNSEIGKRKDGCSKSAISNYKKNITKTIKNIAESSFDKRKGVFIIVVNDKLALYDDIIADAGMNIKKRLYRNVNRRSGRRATSFNEDIIICT
jgi:hypothetical protein